jgi:hypothetical protein
MSIAAFIDPPLSAQHMAVELAVAAAEFCISRNETLYLLADSVTTLEVGISLIGLWESRTVESGESRASPIVLLPFIPRPESVEDQVLWRESESDNGGEIVEFYKLGLFARRGEGAADFDFGSEPAFALQRVIADQNPARILGLGEASPYWEAVGRGLQEAAPPYRPKIITVEGFGSSPFGDATENVFVPRPAVTLIRRPLADLTIEVDDQQALRREAERDGAMVAALFERLSGPP